MRRRSSALSRSFPTARRLHDDRGGRAHPVHREGRLAPESRAVVTITASLHKAALAIAIVIVVLIVAAVVVIRARRTKKGADDIAA